MGDELIMRWILKIRDISEEDECGDVIYVVHGARFGANANLISTTVSAKLVLNPHFSQSFCCGGLNECVCGVTLPRTPRRTSRTLEAYSVASLASISVYFSSPRTLVRNAG